MTPPELDPRDVDLAWLTRLARSLASDENDADDLVQESCMAALDRPPATGVTRAWVATVMRNVQRLRLRRRRRRRAREERAAVREVVVGEAELLERLEVAQRVLHEIKGLSPKYRDVVLYRYHWGMSPNEIASKLNVPVATVHSRLRRAHERLRARLESRLQGELGVALVPLLVRPQPASAATVATVLGGTSLLKKVAAVLVIAVIGTVSWFGYREHWFGAEPGPGPRSIVTTNADDAARTDHPVPATEDDTSVVEPHAPAAAAVVTMFIDQITEQPLPGVVLSDETTERRLAETGPDGRVEIPLEARGLVATKDGYLPAWIFPGRSTGLVRLHRGFAVRGRVVDSDGGPIARAEVTAFTNLAPLGSVSESPHGRYTGDRTPLVRTDAEGFFVIWVPSSTTLLQAWAAGYSAGQSDLLRRADRYPDCIIRLAAGRTLRGRVIGPDASPVAGAEIQCSSSVAGGTLSGPNRMDAVYRTVSGSDGSFELSGVGPEYRVLQVKHARYRTHGATTTIHSSDDEVTIELRLLARVNGRLSIPEGSTLPATGTLYGESFAIDADGSFECEIDPRRLETVEIRVAGFLPRQIPLPPAESAGDVGEVALVAAESFELAVVDDLQAPIGGVRVSISHDEHGWFDCTTDVRGLARFDGPDIGIVRIGISSSEHFMPRVEVDLAQQRGPIELEVPRTASILGTIVDSSGQPLPGVRIDCSYPESEDRQGRGGRFYSARIHTALDGRFRLSGLAAGRTLSFMTTGLGSPNVDVAIDPLDSGEARELGTIVAVGDRRVMGRVLDDAARPVENVMVTITGSYERASYVGTTDANGRFEIVGVSDGHYRLSSNAAGYLSERGRDIDIAGADVTDLEFALRVAAVIEGTVVDGRGRAVSGAAIVFHSDGAGWSSRDQVRTDAEGHYRFPSAPTRKLAVVVRHDDHPGFSARYERLEDVPDPLTIPSGSTLEVRFAYAEGTPPQRPRFELRAEGSRRKLSPMYEPIDGGWRLRGLLPGAWQLRCIIRGRPNVDPQEVVLHPGQTSHVEVSLGAPPIPVTVRVLADGGSPLSAARIDVYYRDGSSVGERRVATNSSGEALVESGIGPNATIEVIALGHAKYFMVDPKIRDDRVEVRLTAESVIDLRVVDSGGQPVAGVRTHIRRRTADETALDGFDIPGGSLRLTGLAAGRYDFQFEREGRQLGQIDVALGSREQRSVVFEVADLISVSGVIAFDGQRVAGGTLSVSRPGISGGQRTTVASDGRFAVDLAGTGRWAFRYRGDSWEGRRTVDIDGTPIALEFSTFTIQGLFLDPEGEPVPSVRGHLVANDIRLRIESDEQGRFSLTTAQLGSYRWRLRGLPTHLDSPSTRLEVDGPTTVTCQLVASRLLEILVSNVRPNTRPATISAIGPNGVSRLTRVVDDNMYRWPVGATSGTVEAEGLAPTLFSVGPEDTRVAVEPEPGGLLEVVLTADGYRVPHRSFHLEPKIGTDLPVVLRPRKTSNRGIAVLYLAPGQYEITVDGGNASSHPVTIAVGESTRLTVPVLELSP